MEKGAEVVEGNIDYKYAHGESVARVNKDGDSIGGWRPKGFVSLALEGQFWRAPKLVRVLDHLK